MTVGDRTAIAGPGTFAYIPAHGTHGFRNVSDEPCTVLHWNSPGGHERLGTAMERLARDGRTSGADRKKAMEDHEYFFHDPSIFDDKS